MFGGGWREQVVVKAVITKYPINWSTVTRRDNVLKMHLFCFMEQPHEVIANLQMGNCLISDVSLLFVITMKGSRFAFLPCGEKSIRCTPCPSGALFDPNPGIS